MLAAAVVPALLIPQRVESAPARTVFSEFPLQLGDWHGQPTRLEEEYVQALKFTDYILADYATASRPPVNFYVSYYDSQRKGESAHSPKVCLPGGGWLIEDFGQRTIPRVANFGRPFAVNRAVMVQGNERQLVYYWFQQRGRIITGEYQLKWFLFWDSLTRNRTDGALVRLITPLGPTTSVDRADAALREFAGVAEPRLQGYLPD